MKRRRSQDRGGGGGAAARAPDAPAPLPGCVDGVPAPLPDAPELLPGCVDDVFRHEILPRLADDVLVALRQVSRAWACACAAAITGAQLGRGAALWQLRPLVNLTALDLGANRTLAPHDLGCFRRLRKLVVHSSSMPLLRNEQLSHVSQLTALHLVHDNELHFRAYPYRVHECNISALQHLPQLRALHLQGGNHGLKDEDASCLTLLEALTLWRTGRYELTGASISRLTALTKLCIHRKPPRVDRTEEESFLYNAHLHPLTNLRTLELGGGVAKRNWALSSACLRPLCVLQTLVLSDADFYSTFWTDANDLEQLTRLETIRLPNYFGSLLSYRDGSNRDRKNYVNVTIDRLARNLIYLQRRCVLAVVELFNAEFDVSAHYLLSAVWEQANREGRSV